MLGTRFVSSSRISEKTVSASTENEDADASYQFPPPTKTKRLGTKHHLPHKPTEKTLRTSATLSFSELFNHRQQCLLLNLFVEVERLPMHSVKNSAISGLEAVKDGARQRKRAPNFATTVQETTTEKTSTHKSAS